MMHEVVLMSEDDPNDIMTWAMQNCASLYSMWTYDRYQQQSIDDKQVRYEFVFREEKDAVIFTLKFGSS
jgi:hypothetical protein